MVPSFPLHIELKVPVLMRFAEEGDLEHMEWFGTFSHDRHIIRDAYERQLRGEGLMLIAEVQGFPAGQLWIDPVERHDERIGIIWAFRVFPFFRRTGLGSRLMDAAEGLLASRGYTTAMVEVDISNDGARRLYERRGYAVVDTVFPEIEVSHQDGTRETIRAHRLVMHKPLGEVPLGRMPATPSAERRA